MHHSSPSYINVCVLIVSLLQIKVLIQFKCNKFASIQTPVSATISEYFQVMNKN